MLLSQPGESVEEAVTLVVGYPDPQLVSVASLPTIVGALAVEYPLISCLRPAQPGLHRPDDRPAVGGAGGADRAGRGRIRARTAGRARAADR